MPAQPQPGGVREGLLLVDKPQGPTSHAVAGRVRTWSGRMRCGHAGTLDPMATGLLILGLGRATRVLGYLIGSDKTYEATVRLGAASDTDDATGTVLPVAPAAGLGAADVEAALQGLRGVIRQVPSAVSAVKVDGRRAYKLVRSGTEVELAAREVRVDELAPLGPLRPVPDGMVDLDLRVRCSSGTYVRALARDLGAALGVGGHLTALRRTGAAAWDVADAVPFAALDPGVGPAGAGLVPADWPVRDPAQVLGRMLATFGLDEAQETWVRNGRRLPVPPTWPGGTVVLTDGRGRFCAVAHARGAELVYEVVFQ